MTRALMGFTIAIACLCGLVIIAGACLFISLPDVTTLKNCVRTEMYHIHLCESDASFTPYKEISPYIIGAVIMSEDASFYSHSGVDVGEMKESAIKDLNEGRFARGGSTITQQLAKNVFLSANKSMVRKLEEIYLALQIEKHFSKTRILTLYLNVVEFGPNIYGIKAASQHYFGKSPAEVSPEESAFLAFLLPNPKKYYQNFDRKNLSPFASKMVKTILHKMYLGSKINESEYQSSLNRVALFPWGAASPSVQAPLSDSLNPIDDASIDGSENSISAEISNAFPPKNNGSKTVPPGAKNHLPHSANQPLEDSPMGIAPSDKDAQGLIPEADEADQKDNDFKFDFQPEEGL